MKKESFMDACVRIMLAAVLIFTIIMIVVFCVKGSVPDQLVICYFVFWSAEGGFLAGIKTVKAKKRGKPKKPPDEEVFKENGNN